MRQPQSLHQTLLGGKPIPKGGLRVEASAVAASLRAPRRAARDTAERPWAAPQREAAETRCYGSAAVASISIRKSGMASACTPIQVLAAGTASP